MLPPLPSMAFRKETQIWKPDYPSQQRCLWYVQKIGAFDDFPLLTIEIIRFQLRCFRARQARVDKVSAVLDISVLSRIFLVPVVHTCREQPCTWEEAKPSRSFTELSWQKPVEVALDKSGVHVSG